MCIRFVERERKRDTDDYMLTAAHHIRDVCATPAISTLTHTHAHAAMDSSETDFSFCGHGHGLTHTHALTQLNVAFVVDAFIDE